MKHSYLLSLILILFTGWSCKTQRLSNLEDDFAPTIEKTNELAKQTMEAGHFPGLAIMVSWKNNLIYSKGFGFSNVENVYPCLSR